MTRAEKLQLAEAIGRYFNAHHMRGHLPLLRAYYVTVRDGRTPHGGWDDDLVNQWAAMLRLPPFQAALEIRPRGSRCCDSGHHSATRPVVFPDGARVTCLSCGRDWLELDAFSPANS